MAFLTVHCLEEPERIGWTDFYVVYIKYLIFKRRGNKSKKGEGKLFDLMNNTITFVKSIRGKIGELCQNHSEGGAGGGGYLFLCGIKCGYISSKI